MHPESYNEMKKHLANILTGVPKDTIVVDFGSQDINGTYRDLVPKQCKYVGVDLEDGKNVDVVMVSEYDSGLPDGYADYLICGQVLEHCRDPFALAKEMARIVKKGGFLIVTAPAMFPEHKFPFDCWRFYPDGMIIIFERAGVRCWQSYTNPCHLGQDCWFVGEKL